MTSVLLAVVALARWLRTEETAALLVAGAGLASAALLVRTLVRPRRAALVTLGALAITLGIATAETRGLRDLDRAGEAWALAARNRDVARVATGIAEAAREAARAAQQSATSGVPSLPVVDGAETGVVLYRNGQPIARGGQARVPLSPGPDGVLLERTAFHDALLARHSRTTPEGTTTAVATVLLSAAPPADRFARALIPQLTSREVVPSLRLDTPSLAFPLDTSDLTRRAVRAMPDTTTVLVVSAAPRSLEEAALSARQSTGATA